MQQRGEEMTREEYKTVNKDTIVHCVEFDRKTESAKLLKARVSEVSYGELILQDWELSAEKAITKFLEARKETYRRLGRLIANTEKLAHDNGISLTKKEQDAVIKEDTQWYRVMKYIEENGSISPKEAFNELGITKLATRISELKARGFKFKQKREKGENRFNEPVCYMRYFEYKEENNL